MLAETVMSGAASETDAVTRRKDSKGDRTKSGLPAAFAGTGMRTEAEPAAPTCPSGSAGGTAPAWAGQEIAPFADVERL